MELVIDCDTQVKIPRAEDMKIGETFRRIQHVHSGSVFIRVEIVKQMAMSKDDRDIVICNLMTGRVYCMYGAEVVIPVNAKIRISAYDYNKQS